MVNEAGLRGLRLALLSDCCVTDFSWVVATYMSVYPKKKPATEPSEPVSFTGVTAEASMTQRQLHCQSQHG